MIFFFNFSECNQGQCECKVNVEGIGCDRCHQGTFGLEESNPLGCTPCWCSGQLIFYVKLFSRKFS